MARPSLVVLALAIFALVGCGNPNTVFATLMQRPDIDQATQHYEQMGSEVRQALAQAIPELSSWQKDGDVLNSACGADYPGIGFDGQTRNLPGYVVTGNLADAKYEQALRVIGTVAQKYGFTPQPQRLHDAPGSHDAVFHNVHDDGGISFGTAKNTSIDLEIACHLTAAAKKRGHLTPPPTY